MSVWWQVCSNQESGELLQLSQQGLLYLARHGSDHKPIQEVAAGASSDPALLCQEPWSAWLSCKEPSEREMHKSSMVTLTLPPEVLAGKAPEPDPPDNVFDPNKAPWKPAQPPQGELARVMACLERDSIEPNTAPLQQPARPAGRPSLAAA